MLAASCKSLCLLFFLSVATIGVQCQEAITSNATVLSILGAPQIQTEGIHENAKVDQDVAEQLTPSRKVIIADQAQLDRLTLIVKLNEPVVNRPHNIRKKEQKRKPIRAKSNNIGQYCVL